MGGWEETRAGQVIPAEQRDIPDRVTSCSVYKMGGRRRKRGDVWSGGVCLSK